MFANKKLLISITIITAFLFILAIGGIYYYKNSSTQIAPTTTQAATCGVCYWIDPNNNQTCENTTPSNGRYFKFFENKAPTITDCGGPQTAINYRHLGLATTSSECENSFKEQCNNENESITFIDNNCFCRSQIELQPCTYTDNALSCESSNLCTGIVLKSDKDEILTEGKEGLTMQIPITAEATFYHAISSTDNASYSLNINGEMLSPIQAENKQQVNNFKIEAISQKLDPTVLQSKDILSIQSLPNTSDENSSPLCAINIPTQKISQVTCTKLSIAPTNLTYTSDHDKVLESISLKLTNLKDLDKPSIHVQILIGKSSFTTTGSLEAYLKDNILTLDKGFINDPKNFSEGKSPNSALTDGNTSIKAIIMLEDEEVSSCSSGILVQKTEEDEEEEQQMTMPNQDLRAEDQGTQETDENSQAASEPESSQQTSSLWITKTGASCVERVAPNNETTFTISIENKGDIAETFTEIIDKLPRGFTYKVGSTTINNQTYHDNNLNTQMSGESQQLTWTNETDGWLISPGETITLQFTAIAGNNALTGAAMNEALVTPSLVPGQESRVRTSYTINVAQSCTTPKTGVFDSAIARMVIGVIILILGVVYYIYSTTPETLAKTVIKTDLTNKTRLSLMKYLYPFKHFEEKTLYDQQNNDQADSE